MYEIAHAWEGDMAQRATERIEFRVRPEVAERIRDAADASHMTVSAFITSAATAKADEVLVDKLVWKVSSEEFEEIQRHLDEPPTPNENLIAAFRRAREVILHDTDIRLRSDG